MTELKSVSKYWTFGVFKGGGEKHHRYVGFRYIIRVFLMVFFSTLTYLRGYVRVFFIVFVELLKYLITYLKDKVHYKVRVRVL